MKKLLKGILSLAIIGSFAGGCFAWDDDIAGTTEITGYYQQYRDFSMKTGNVEYDFAPARLSGGGFSVAHNIADWFAIWTQLSFYGTVDQGDVIAGQYQFPKTARMINNLEGIRYQTKQYGPFQLYGKGGLGFTWYSLYGGVEGGMKFSAGYGGGVNIWINNNIGITLDLTHVVMGLPKVTEREDRKKFDSGLTYTPGLTFRF